MARRLPLSALVTLGFAISILPASLPAAAGDAVAVVAVSVGAGEWNMTQFSIAPGSYTVWLRSYYQNYSNPGELGWGVVDRETFAIAPSLTLYGSPTSHAGIFAHAADGSVIEQDVAVDMGETPLRSFAFGYETTSTSLGDGTFFLLTFANVDEGSLLVKVEAAAGAIVPIRSLAGTSTARFDHDDFEGAMAAVVGVPGSSAAPGLSENSGTNAYALVSHEATFGAHPYMMLKNGAQHGAGRLAIIDPNGLEHANFPTQNWVRLTGEVGPGNYRARFDASEAVGAVGMLWSIVDYRFPDEGPIS